MKKAYLIADIEEYGKLVSLCVENDISVWRLYWDEREKGDRCYEINWQEKRCYYSSRKYYENEGYKIIAPIFNVDKFGRYKIINNPTEKGGVE